MNVAIGGGKRIELLRIVGILNYNLTRSAIGDFNLQTASVAKIGYVYAKALIRLSEEQFRETLSSEKQKR